MATNGLQSSTMGVALKRSIKSYFMCLCPYCALLRPKLGPKNEHIWKASCGHKGIKAAIDLKVNFTATPSL